MSESSQQHQDHAAKHVRKNPVRCAVLTVSDTRTMENDKGGALIVQHLQIAGHIAAARAIVKDDAAQIRSQIETWLDDSAIHAILTTGGTGIAKRDSTIEVVRDLLTIELEGYGELFRMLSYEQVKAAAMMSRAVGGLVIRSVAPREGANSNASNRETFIFAMPGSPNAVELAMNKLIVPQLPHLVWERNRSK